MEDAKTYREYASECKRISKSMDETDREILLEMAKTWEDRARGAESSERAEKSNPMRTPDTS